MRVPAISVAMSVYNGERFLAEAVESVLAQSFGDFEFLILDDGSSDATPQIVQDFAARDSRVRLIVRENRGLIASLNELIAEARAPLIARMDADDICMPERFARQVEFLTANPDYGVVGSAAYDIDENGKYFAAPDYPPPLNHEEVLAMIEQNPPLCHPSVLVRRDVLLAAGGYHAAFRHCEDYDLWLRLANRTRIGNLADKLLHYRRYDGQISNRHSIMQHYGAAVAVLAYQQRAAGRPDPTEHLEVLPPVEQLGELFGRAQVVQEIRAKVARGLLHSRTAMRGEGFDLLLGHIGDGGRGSELWRTVPRLLRFGEPARAARLAAALTRATIA
jgi:glycosyltransferase involved in cell wall biosynthesis